MTVIEVDRQTLIGALSQGSYQTLILEKHYTDPQGAWIERLTIKNAATGRSTLEFEKVKNEVLDQQRSPAPG